MQELHSYCAWKSRADRWPPMRASLGTPDVVQALLDPRRRESRTGMWRRRPQTWRGSQPRRVRRRTLQDCGKRFRAESLVQRQTGADPPLRRLRRRAPLLASSCSTAGHERPRGRRRRAGRFASHVRDAVPEEPGRQRRSRCDVALHHVLQGQPPQLNYTTASAMPIGASLQTAAWVGCGAPSLNTCGYNCLIALRVSTISGAPAIMPS